MHIIGIIPQCPKARRWGRPSTTVVGRNTGEIPMAEATQTEHKQVIERYLASINEHDPESLPDTVAEDVVVHGLIGADDDINGIEEYGKWGSEMLSGIPDFTIELEDYFESGNKVAARWTLSGTLENGIYDLPATNQAFEITGFVIFRLEDGKIAEKWYQQDDLGMLQQVGIIEGL